MQDSDFLEGDADSSELTNLDLTWVYSGGHTGSTSSLVTAYVMPAAEGEGQAVTATGRRLLETSSAVDLPDISDDVVSGRRTLTQTGVEVGEFVNAHNNPIEMVVNMPYVYVLPVLLPPCVYAWCKYISLQKLTCRGYASIVL